MRQAREYTAEQLDEIHREQVQVALPLVLRVWQEIKDEERRRLEAVEVDPKRRAHEKAS